MKKAIVILATLTAGALAMAQAPSPAPGPVPEMKPEAGPRMQGGRGGMGERRFSGGMMEGRDFSFERIVASIAMGQGEVAKKLNLTADQEGLIKRLVQEQRTKMIDLQASLQKTALKQAEVLTAEPLDEAALMAAVEESAKTRTELAKSQIQLLLDVRKALTEEQRKTLREMIIQARQQPFGNRPGMEERREGRPGGERERGGDRERGNREGREQDRGERPAPPPAPPAAPPA